jgi:hypothetical protein
MKKKIVYGISVLAIAAVAAWNVGLSSQKNDGLSDVMLANVEALADGESQYVWYGNRDDVYDEEKHCYMQCVIDGGGCPYWYDFPHNC